MTFEPSPQTDFWLILGVSPTSSSEVHRARTSAARTPKAVASKAKGPASTSKPSASSEKSDLVGLLLRTALISELGALTPSSLHWRRSTTPAGRSWFVLQTSAPTTNAPEAGSSGSISGSLPTPMASDGMKDGAGGGAGSTYPFRKILATPRKTGADRGFRGDVLSQLQGHNSRHAGMLHTPTAMANMHNPSMEKWPSCHGWGLIANPETLPTPTKRDKRMDAWSPAYDKRKSPTMDAVVDGAMTNRAPDKWQYARQIAAVLQQANLFGASQTLPVVYSWMMGYPPAWLERALLSAVDAGLLPLASSSKPMGTRSCRRSRKR